MRWRNKWIKWRVIPLDELIFPHEQWLLCAPVDDYSGFYPIYIYIGDSTQIIQDGGIPFLTNQDETWKFHRGLFHTAISWFARFQRQIFPEAPHDFPQIILRLTIKTSETIQWQLGLGRIQDTHKMAILSWNRCENTWMIRKIWGYSSLFSANESRNLGSEWIQLRRTSQFLDFFSLK